MRAAAFDLSLTSTGWARSSDSALPSGFHWESGVLKPEGTGVRRLWMALHAITGIARGCDVVVLEGYAHGAKHQTHQLGELGGVVKLGFYQSNIPVVVVPPTKLKKFATGKGSGKKEAPFAEAIRRLGYDGYSHDEADALWLLQMAIHHYKLPGLVELPKLHLTALYDEVKWPRIE